nr:MAG TPA: Protein of unknown function (DUF3185) [Caudoviricetes sp.]
MIEKILSSDYYKILEVISVLVGVFGGLWGYFSSKSQKSMEKMYTTRYEELSRDNKERLQSYKDLYEDRIADQLKILDERNRVIEAKDELISSLNRMAIEKEIFASAPHVSEDYAQPFSDKQGGEQDV